MAAFFLILLLVASGSFFGMKVARSHRGEPWVATERFKDNLASIGPQGVDAAAVRPRSARSRGGGRQPGSPRAGRQVGGLSDESLQFVLALLVAASAFTFVCALLGMLAWEFSLGAIAGTGLFVAFLLEGRQSRRRATSNLAYMRNYLPVHDDEIEDEHLYAGGYG